MSAITTTARVSLAQYERMVDEGIFGDRAPIELLDGELVARMPRNPPHCVVDDLCGAALERVVPSGWHVRPTKPIRLPPQDSEPEPDRCVVRGRIRDYVSGHPGPGEIALVVEIADSLLDQDRGRKLVAYATAGIAVYWIVNQVDEQVEVYTEPRLGSYESRMEYKRGQAFGVVIEGDAVGEIAVDDILP